MNNDKRIEGVAQRMIELKNEIPEEMKKLGKLNNLPPCVRDG